jgi:hypothetical protein
MTHMHMHQGHPNPSPWAGCCSTISCTSDNCLRSVLLSDRALQVAHPNQHGSSCWSHLCLLLQDHEPPLCCCNCCLQYFILLAGSCGTLLVILALPVPRCCRLLKLSMCQLTGLNVLQSYQGACTGAEMSGSAKAKSLLQPYCCRLLSSACGSSLASMSCRCMHLAGLCISARLTAGL